MDNIRVGFKRLTDEAILPTKAHKEDSGADLFALEDVIISPEETKVIKTGIAVLLPKGYEAQIRPRSGITSRTNLRVQLGTIDNGFTGELGVIADNRVSKNTFKGAGMVMLDGEIFNPGKIYELGTIIIKRGDKVAQLVTQKLSEVSIFEIEGDIDDTERGSNGYGSTGV